jgi:hypothetical protein
MAGENEALTLVGYKVNTGSVAAAVAANKQVEASIKSVGAASASNALRFDSIADAQKALGLTNAQLGITESNITAEKTKQLALTQRLAAAERVRANAVEDVALAELRAGANGAAGGAGGGSGPGRSIQRFSRGLFNLPDVQLTPGISTTVLSRLGLVAGAATEALGLTTVALGGIVAVAALVTVAIGSIISAENERIEAAKKNADQLKSLAERVSSGATSQDVLQRSRELEQQRDLLVQGQDSLKGYQVALDGVNDAYENGRISPDQYRAALTDLNASLNDATGGALGFKDGVGQEIATRGDLNAAVEANQKNIAAVTGELAVNNIALNSQEIAANNAAAALQLLTETQLEAADLTLEIDRLTTEEREKRAAQVARDIEILFNLQQSGEVTGDAMLALSDQITELGNEYAQLTSTTSTYADELEREAAAKQAVTDAYDNYNELLDQEADAREDLADVQAKVAGIVAKREEDIADLREDIADRSAQREEDLGERRLEIAENSADRIAKIERDAARSLQTAIGERDAYGFKQAEQRRADALEDQAEADEKQLDNLAKQQAKAAKVEADGMEKRIQRLIRDTGRQIDIEQGKARILENVISTSITSQAFLTQHGFNAITNIWAQGMTQLTVLTNQAFNNMSGNRLVGGGSQFPQVQGYGVMGTNSSTQAAFNQRFDARLNQALQGAVQINGRSSYR